MKKSEHKTMIMRKRGILAKYLMIFLMITNEYGISINFM